MFLKRQCKRYLQIYDIRECPLVLAHTYRYDIKGQATVLARRWISQGTVITAFTGRLVDLEPNEENSMNKDSSHWDFSVVYSLSRKKSQLFLGPARFANHDCNSNCEVISCKNAGKNPIFSWLESTIMKLGSRRKRTYRQGKKSLYITEAIISDPITYNASVQRVNSWKILRKDAKCAMPLPKVHHVMYVSAILRFTDLEL